MTRRVNRSRKDDGRANAKCGCARPGQVDSGIETFSVVVVVAIIQVLAKSSEKIPSFAGNELPNYGHCAVEDIVFDR